MTQIFYGNLDLVDDVYNELAFYDHGVEGLGFADGILDDDEIANIATSGNYEDGLALVKSYLKTRDYYLAESDEGFTVVSPECPDGQVFIRSGVFDMGSDASYAEIDEKPVHPVGVSGLCYDAMETTNSWYNDYVPSVSQSSAPEPRFTAVETCTTTSREVTASTREKAEDLAKKEAHEKTVCKTVVTDETPHDDGSRIMNRSPEDFNDPNQPVVNVSWYHASAACESRRGLDGNPMFLPTEAEQEWVARDGGEGNQFPTGDTISTTQANYGMSVKKTTDVASYSPNSHGVYDVAGNVWEWGADWYGEYSSSFQQDPTGPVTGDYRVLRGGSWSNYGGGMRSSNRGSGNPDDGDNGFGFRCGSSPRTPKE